MIALLRLRRAPFGPTALDQRGIALAAAVFAMAMLSALVASTFFAGRLEQQSGRNAVFAAQAREAAEAGLAESVANTPAEMLESLTAGAMPLELGTLTLGPGVTVESRVTRITSRVFLIRVEGQRADQQGTVLARRALALLVQLTARDSASAGEPESSSTLTPLRERAWVQLY